MSILLRAFTVLFAAAFLLNLVDGKGISEYTSSDARRDGDVWKPSCRCANSTTRSKRVVGGIDASTDEFPYAVALEYNWQKKVIFCSGTLITDRHVLTAAHCFTDNQNYNRKYLISVVIKAHDMKNPEVGVKVIHREVRQIIFYPDWDYEVQTDIAIVEMESCMDRNEYLATAWLPQPYSEIPNPNARLAAFGSSWANPSDNPSPALKKMYLKQSICAKEYLILNRIMCAESTSGSRVSAGDYGGGIILDEENGIRNTVVGITVKENRFIKVSKFFDWIYRVTQYGACCQPCVKEY